MDTKQSHETGVIRFNHEENKLHAALGLTEKDADRIHDMLKDALKKYDGKISQARMMQELLDKGLGFAEVLYAMYGVGDLFTRQEIREKTSVDFDCHAQTIADGFSAPENTIKLLEIAVEQLMREWNGDAVARHAFWHDFEALLSGEGPQVAALTGFYLGQAFRSHKKSAHK